MKRNYYDYLKEEFDQYQGDYDSYLHYSIDFFKLLCDLLDEDIASPDRNRINAALAYFVSPLDVYPEDLHGPEGYTDDIYVCVLVLRDLRTKYKEIVDRCWAYDDRLSELLELCYTRSSKKLDEWGLRQKTLKYSGLNELLPKEAQ